MKNYLIICIFIFICRHCDCADHSKFRTCKESGFCKYWFFCFVQFWSLTKSISTLNLTYLLFQVYVNYAIFLLGFLGFEDFYRYLYIILLYLELPWICDFHYWKSIRSIYIFKFLSLYLPISYKNYSKIFCCHLFTI